MYTQFKNFELVEMFREKKFLHYKVRWVNDLKK